MATYRYHLRRSKKEGSGDGKLFIRVIQGRKFKDIATSHGISASEWNESGARIRYHSGDPSRNDFLAEIERTMRSNLSTLDILARRLEESGSYTASDLVAAFKDTYRDTHNILAYCDNVGARLAGDGQARTARAYRSAARSFVAFRGGRSTTLEDIDATMMREYESHLKKRGLSMNSISFYIRNIRALYYRAVADKLILPQRENSFLGVYTGVYVSKKRSLHRDELAALRGLHDKLDSVACGDLVPVPVPVPDPDLGSDLDLDSDLDSDLDFDSIKVDKPEDLSDALLYFEFCLEGRGISWVDMAYLKKADLRNDMFTYRRKKTGRPLEVYITSEMRKIIDHFRQRTKNSPYVFPVIDATRGNERRQYETGLRLQNRRLGQLAALAGIGKKVTTHVARHTWATTARNNGIDVPVIGEMLGHSDHRVTLRYLDSIESELVIKVSQRVAKAMRKVA